MNCPNCGASLWSNGRCEFCWSPDPRLKKDLETVSHAYYYGFIDDTQRNKLARALSLPSMQELVSERQEYLVAREIALMEQYP